MIKILISINPSQNRQRFYRVAIEPTLLGEVCLTRSWGRIGGAEERLAPVIFGDWDAAIAAAGKVVKKKLKRGYVER